MKFDIFSIGHSTHSRERFSALLSRAGVTAIADVRSSPFSRHTPHFSQNELKQWLKHEGIAYVFLGKELGGRPSQASLYRNGVADYEAMAGTAGFADGIERLISGSDSHRIAMMCAEHDPLDCHRCLLVARHLAGKGIHVGHILLGGKTVSQEQIEDRLLELEGFGADDFFHPRPERLAAAYRQRNMKVAYAETPAAAASG